MLDNICHPESSGLPTAWFLSFFWRWLKLLSISGKVGSCVKLSSLLTVPLKAADPTQTGKAGGFIDWRNAGLVWLMHRVRSQEKYLSLMTSSMSLRNRTPWDFRNSSSELSERNHSEENLWEIYHKELWLVNVSKIITCSYMTIILPKYYEK